jgi:hypothetical protein
MKKKLFVPLTDGVPLTGERLYASPWSGQESSNQAQKRSGRRGITWCEGIDALEIMMGNGGVE